MLKAAFIFIARGFEGRTEAKTIDTPQVSLTTIGVSSYSYACEVAKELHKDGYAAIELCSGFGYKGASMIADAVNNEIPVGAVRFDYIAGAGPSGDTLFM